MDSNLAELHRHLQNFHQEAAKADGRLAAHHRTMVATAESDAATGHHQALADHHDAMMRCHLDQVAYHAAAASGLDVQDLSQKAAGVSQVNASNVREFLIAPPISGVVPDVPDGVRAVPRHGQRGFEQAAGESDPMFRKLFAGDDA